MKKILFYTFLICFVRAYSQKQASNWYFGDFAGINFDTNTGTVTALTDGQLRTDEGCTSISDDDGNLLFYTDGITVYNIDTAGNHQVMDNGDFLFGNPSSTQSAIIIPKPDNPNIYYIFTQGTTFTSQQDFGFRYSEVDMSLNGGLGAVTRMKNERLLYKASEKLGAVLKDCESGNIYVVTLAASDAQTNPNAVDNNNTTFYVYEVSNTGVNLSGSYNTGRTINERRGYLKISPDGTKLVAANIRDGLLLYDFDVTDGSIAFNQQININSTGLNGATFPYGIEFSSNSQVLYVSTYNDFSGNGDNNPSNHRSALLQYDVSLNNPADLNASQTNVEIKQGYRSALQLGPDSKIYKTESSTYNNGLPNLSTIELPNIVGTDCTYLPNTVSLNGRNGRQGLPPFIASYFSEKIDITSGAAESNNLSLCAGDTFTLIAESIPGATYTWTLDGNPLPTPTPPNELFLNTGGNYTVFIEIPSNDCESKEGQAIVTFYDVPVANTALKLDACSDDLTTDFDLTVRDADILGTQDPSIYEVHYFESQLDAENNENEIMGLFTNTLNPTPIFARIHNKNNPNCYDTTSFEVEVFITPTANPITDQIWCDDATDGDATNGQTDIDLLSFNPMFLDTQSPIDFSVSYHTSQANANSGMSPLPDTYYNQTAFQEEIFVRVENVLNSDCFNTTSFNVVVNPLPPAFNSSLIQCDEDANQDGRTAFNLDEAFDALSGNSTTVSIEYYDNQTDANSGSDMLAPLGYVNTSNPEVVIAKIIDNTTLCYSLVELSLEVSTTQINNYQAPEVCDELDSEDGINTFDLNEITVAIQQDNTITFPVTYYENYNDALLEQNVLTTPFNNTIPYNQTIYSRVENNNACYGIGEVTLTINPRPQLEADETVLYCLNTFPDTISLEAGILNDSANNYTYAWSSGQTTSTIAINEIGNYTVTATNNSGCTQTRTITVEPSNIATIESITIRDALRGNNTITVIVSGEGEYEYALFDVDGLLYASYQTSNEFTNVDPGIYTVSIRDVKNNCGVVDDMVSVIGFPNVFTPNGDGTNDTWNVQGVTALFQPSTRVQIFNRYGKLLKELSPLNGGWDGTYNGEIMPNDDYWFTVKLQDGRIFKSHFTLKR